MGCHFCESLCPTGALAIRRNPSEIKLNALWSGRALEDISRQSATGGVLLTGMGNDRPFPVYFDHLLLNASQVTNPSIDPLREPMELRTYLGGKPDRLEVKEGQKPEEVLKSFLSSQIPLETPILFTAMSNGSISLNAVRSLAMAAKEAGTLWNTGEGGLHPDLYPMSAAYLREMKRFCAKEVPMAKYFATEAAERACYNAMQMLGGYGYRKEYPIERYNRDVRITSIYEGTSLIQRMIIARNILGDLK